MKTKQKKRFFVSSGVQKPEKRSIRVKGEWKAVDLDPSLFSQEGLEGLVCFEELRSYRLVDTEQTEAQASRQEKKKKSKKRKAVDEEEEEEEEISTGPAKKKAKKKKKKKVSQDESTPEKEEMINKEPTEDPTSASEPQEPSEKTKKSKKKRKKKKKKPKQRIEETAGPEEKEEMITEEPTEDPASTSEPQEPSEKSKKSKKKVSKDESTPEEKKTVTEEPTEDPASTCDPQKPSEKKKKKVSQDESTPEEKEEMITEEPTEDPASTSDPQKSSEKTKKKRKKKPKQEMEEAAEPEEENMAEDPVDPPLLVEVKKPPQKRVKNWTEAALGGSARRNADVSAWKQLFVPPPVLEALSSLGFASPTPIQALALPSAIRDRMDVLGAAETGSGKTLAFGIPMIHAILEWKKTAEEADAPSEPGLEEPPTEEPPTEEPPTEEDPEKGETEASEDEDEEEEEEEDEVEDSEDEDERLDSIRLKEEAESEEEPGGGSGRPLLGLVLTPTRELAVQVKHHIDAVAKFTDIRTAIVVGGMAQQKQRRMLKRRPEVVIATPGRLWDLIKERHPHLLNLRQLKCLVIDEADRMVERGHFAELENLLEMLNTAHFNPTRQTFVFSATLTMVHSLPTRLLQKKKKKVDTRSRLEILMEKVGIKSKPKVIDLTRKEATVETLTETQIHCQKEDKDFYLYYFLLQYPGRTMVFANSIDCIKRLNSLLVILDVTPLPLHANMHQKQRLKNLERFAERDSCVLLTTDVAARGLDIPNVQHVIHYQVPRTSETYVHRSGRTARATKEGLSLLLIGPDDMMNFKKIYKTLGKDEELPMFPVEDKCMAAIKERVNLARSIEKMEYYNSKEKQHNSWFRQAAEALEVDLDDDLLLGTEKDEDDDREQQRRIKGMKKQLKLLISQPIFKNALKTKYPTQMGKLPLAHLTLAHKESALTRVSMEGKRQKFKKSVRRQKKGAPRE